MIEPPQSSYWTSLNNILDNIYAEKDEMELSLKDLATASGLCYQTITRINRRATRYPRLSTVMRLAATVGLEFNITAKTHNQPRRKRKSA